MKKAKELKTEQVKLAKKSKDIEVEPQTLFNKLKDHLKMGSKSEIKYNASKNDFGAQEKTFEQVYQLKQLNNLI